MHQQVLSDVYAPTRSEVTKQLHKLFKNKDNVARLRTFTERFRARLVEMAAQDSEINVRVSTIELLDTVRKTGLLEPDDIDNVGRLVFDAEPRVRKAVGNFFAENVHDHFESTVEDLGGEEGLVEIMGEEVEDEYDRPRISWLTLKCMAEALQSYDAGDEDSSQTRGENLGLIVTGNESRYTLAAQTICNGLPEAQEWEVIAGYLLYDFSDAQSSAEAADTDVKKRLELNEQERTLLLAVLNVAVTNTLSEGLEGESEKKRKKTKAQKEEAQNIREAAALHLAKLIPRLLKRFGTNPTTTTAVLRLEHVLNLEIFQELRQDSTTYASLMDDIKEQFLTHADRDVVAEASTALLHARTYDDLHELTKEKLGNCWDDCIEGLRTLMRRSKILDNIVMICHTVRRIEHLASISDCVDIFEVENRTAVKQKSGPVTLRDMLMEILRDPSLDSEAGEEADEVLVSTMKSLLFYYMWSTRNLRNAIASKEAIADLPDFQPFSQALTSIINTREPLFPIRISAIGTLLDLYTLFATFRHTPSSSDTNPNIDALTQHIPSTAQPLIQTTYHALEKLYAKKTRKTLQAAVNDDLDSEPEDSDDDNDEDDHASLALQVEKQLCELAGKMVLAIVGRVLDHEGPKRGKLKERLQRNRLKLGANYKEVIAYLDGPKVAKKGKAKKAAGPTKTGAKKGAKSVERVVDEESEDEEERSEDEGERELVEDRIEDPDGDAESVGGGGGGGEGNARAGADDDDEIMGD